MSTAATQPGSRMLHNTEAGSGGTFALLPDAFGVQIIAPGILRDDRSEMPCADLLPAMQDAIAPFFTIAES